MKYPEKIDKWISKKAFPQRVLLSGKGNLIEVALEMAAKLQQESVTKIDSGIQTDTLVLRDEGESFKIGEDSEAGNSARGLIRWVSQKPVSPYRIVILENFERASRDSPQALLKILEEPPEKGIFIFTTQNHYQVLETILSRMTVVRIASEVRDFSILPEIETFLRPSNLIGKFKIIESLEKEAKKIKDKRVIKQFVDQLIQHAQGLPQYNQYLADLFEIQQNMQQHLNTKLVLERFALKVTKQ